MALVWKGKTRIIAKFLRTDLVICSHSREGKNLSYSRINTVTGLTWKSVSIVLLMGLLLPRFIMTSAVSSTCGIFWAALGTLWEALEPFWADLPTFPLGFPFDSFLSGLAELLTMTALGVLFSSFDSLSFQGIQIQ